MDLPTAWNLDNKSTNLNVDSSGLRVNYENEVDIIDEGKDTCITIGFCKKSFNLNGRMPGWDDDSWGYGGYSGNFYCCFVIGSPYGPSFSTGDTIGCCLNFKNNTVFYTKNGVNIGIAFRNLKGTLYPCVGLHSHGDSIEVNFGSRKFKYAVNT
ncbi:concanavalin A-like lectin/glucanase domain-containing protein [Gigaspora rosea]|uniref:Concanavalin A-like lectin/glucanase domain-containing protein n=1 Tax=Gigaspora rosea TaxID=44941 RepID=A0A397UZZ1_9GLOM|nr:concanavalin A-like lectin/glucanase domain-containing protein [Gigaspora rosea]